MATSIRDLVHALESEAPYQAGTDRQSHDAAGALYELGRALRQLATDGLELDINGRRENIARDLAESCVQTAATIEINRSGRLTILASTIADIVGIRRDEFGRDQRWAITIELANAARVLTTYAAEGDGRRTADLAWTHLTARALVLHARQDGPSGQSEEELDRPVPRAMIPSELDPAQQAMESLIVISNRLRRSSAQLDRPPSLLEVFAVSRAAESTTRYAIATAATLAREPMPDARPSAAIWHEVRDRLRPFATAAPLHPEDRDLGEWAQRVHSELRREFGHADQPELTANGHMKVEAVRHLQVMVNEVPSIAEHVATAVEQLADRGDLHALAIRLPFREQRLEQFLTKHGVVADRFDVAPIIDRLGDAAQLAAELSTSLDRAAGGGDRSLKLGLRAEHAARVTEQRQDPLAPLLSQLGNSNQTADQIVDQGTESTQRELMHTDDVDHSADFDLGPS